MVNDDSPNMVDNETEKKQKNTATEKIRGHIHINRKSGDKC